MKNRTYEINRLSTCTVITCGSRDLTLYLDGMRTGGLSLRGHEFDHTSEVMAAIAAGEIEVECGEADPNLEAELDAIEAHQARMAHVMRVQG